MPKAPYGRYREAGSFTYIPCYWLSEGMFTCAGNNLTRNPYYLVQSGTFRTISDVVTPGFRERVKRGDVLMSPYTSTYESVAVSGNFSQVRSNAQSCSSPLTYNTETLNGPWALYYANGGPRLSYPSLISESDIDSLVHTAATKAWADLAQHDADIVTDIAEFRKTARMFTKPLSSANSLLSSATRAKRAGTSKAKEYAKGTSSTAQNLWLQYRYGVRPLVSSVNGIVKSLAAKQISNRVTARASQALKSDLTETGSASTWSTNFNWRKDSTHTVTVRATILATKVVRLSQRLGVDAGAMLTTPWELVPYSFVADWFINVGDFLEAAVPYLTTTPLGSCWTVEHTKTATWYVTGSSAKAGSGYSMIRQVQENHSGVYKSKQRFLAIPAPSVVVKPRALEGVFSDLRAIDSLALTLQRLGQLFKG